MDSDSTVQAQIQPCPHCEALLDVSAQEPLAEIVCPACGGPLQVPGQIAHFELVSVAGRGGMGVVYKARDQSLDRMVALKLLRKDHSDNAALIAQLETEAAITASISHPHVVKVFSTGTDAQGCFFLAMELVDKGSLDDLMRVQGRVAEAQALEVGLQIAMGLRAALEHGLIHRDVKPGNILFADAHTAKIVDFGLAIFMEQEESVRGEIWGTPYYVAPEKLDGKPEDFRSDIYSLGASLFHAMAGRPPFEAETASLVALKHLKAQPVSLQAFAPHVSGRTAFIINRMLSKDPAARYQSYDELIEHFQYAREELLSSGGAKPKAHRVVLESESDQKIWGWVTLGMIGVMALGGLGVFVFRDRLFPSTPAPIVEQNPEATPDGKVREKLLAGDSAGAALEFRKIAGDAGADSLRGLVALTEAAIAEMTGGHWPEAQSLFEKIAKSNASALRTPEEQKLGAILVEMAHKALGDEPIDPAPFAEMARNNPQSIVLLVYGLKNWGLEKIEQAVPFFRQFRSMTPPVEWEWVTALKPLASNYIDQVAQFQISSDRFKSAKSLSEKKAIIEELGKFSGPFHARIAALNAKLRKDQEEALKSLEPWVMSDLGSVTIPGSAQRDAKSGHIEMTASGSDIWTSPDSGSLLYQKIRGDFEFVARVASVQKVAQYTKGGLMVRESLSAESRYVAAIMSPGRASFQRRIQKGKPSFEITFADIAPPYWLKLVRKDALISGFASKDGNEWRAMGTETLNNLGAEVYVGFAACSHVAASTATAHFESVRLTPAP